MPEAVGNQEREAAIDRFVELFYEDGRHTWETTKWDGVHVYKLPLDLWVMQEIVFETEPELIIETGVAAGGSTLFFANLLDVVGSGRIVGVDVDLSNVHEKTSAHPRVTLFEASSTDPDTVARLRASAEGKRTMVILDSDHRAAHVAAELGELADLVSPGCYLIVEDGIVNGHPVEPEFGPGPAEALAIWLEGEPPFDVDPSRERLMASHNPGGYLRRHGELAPRRERDGTKPPGRNGDGEPAAAELVRRLNESEREREELRGLADQAEAARQQAAALENRVAELEPEVDSARASLRRTNERVAELRQALEEQGSELERERRRGSWLRAEAEDERRRWSDAAEAKQRELDAVSARLEGIKASMPMRAYERLRSVPPISWVSKRREARTRAAWEAAERERLDSSTDET